MRACVRPLTVAAGVRWNISVAEKRVVKIEMINGFSWVFVFAGVRIDVCGGALKLSDWITESGNRCRTFDVKAFRNYMCTLADGALVMHFIRHTEPRLAKIQYSRKQYGCVPEPQTSAAPHAAR